MSAVSGTFDENGNNDGHSFQIGDFRGFEQLKEVPMPVAPVTAPVVSAPPVAAPVPTTVVASAPAAVLTTAKLLSQLRARLRVVEREIKQRKTLEQERDTIKRLIAASLNERDNVRRLRSAG